MADGTHQFPIDSAADQQHKRRRGGFARAHRFAHVVDGQYVTTAQIAERLGVSMTTAYGRARRGPFPLTWAGLTERNNPCGQSASDAA